MTTTQITVDTAPRDLEGLKKIGRFNLRLVAQQLGIFATEAAKTAFMQQSNDAQAETVKKLLDAHFATKGTGTAKPAATGRNPSTKNAGKAAAAASEPAADDNTGAATGGKGVGGGENAAKILAAIQGLREECAGFRESIDNLTATISQLQGISAGTNRFVAMAIGLSGKLAEQTLGASLETVLEAVVEDMPAVEAAMRTMPGAEEEEAEEEEAGNDEE